MAALLRKSGWNSSVTAPATCRRLQHGDLRPPGQDNKSRYPLWPAPMMIASYAVVHQFHLSVCVERVENVRAKSLDFVGRRNGTYRISTNLPPWRWSAKVA